jgi:hypothetical protein
VVWRRGARGHELEREGGRERERGSVTKEEKGGE